MYFLLLVIDFPNQYKTIHCKSTNKNSVCNKLYHTYYNSLENLNQFIDKFPITFYSVDTNMIIMIKIVSLSHRYSGGEVYYHIIILRPVIKVQIVKLNNKANTHNWWWGKLWDRSKLKFVQLILKSFFFFLFHFLRFQVSKKA